MTWSDYLAQAGDLDATTTYWFGLATEAAGIASAHGQELAALAGPSARAAWAWASTDGLEHLANGAEAVADGVLDVVGSGMDDAFAVATSGGAIDGRARRHVGHPHAIDRPRTGRR